MCSVSVCPAGHQGWWLIPGHTKSKGCCRSKQLIRRRGLCSTIPDLLLGFYCHCLPQPAVPHEFSSFSDCWAQQRLLLSCCIMNSTTELIKLLSRSLFSVPIACFSVDTVCDMDGTACMAAGLAAWLIDWAWVPMHAWVAQGHACMHACMHGFLHQG